MPAAWFRRGDTGFNATIYTTRRVDVWRANKGIGVAYGRGEMGCRASPSRGETWKLCLDPRSPVSCGAPIAAVALMQKIDVSYYYAAIGTVHTKNKGVYFPWNSAGMSSRYERMAR